MFSEKELETIAFLINFYIMNESFRNIRKDVKLLENKVKGELNSGNSNNSK